ncbi:MAG: DUF1778 domain-containing protein [Beijerinckiaceae bacterium]
MSKRRSSSSKTAGASASVTTKRPSAPDNERSIDVSDQLLFVLDSDRYDAFLRALDNPPAPGPKLRSLVRRVPRWRK